MEREDPKVKFIIAAAAFVVFLFVIFPLWNVLSSTTISEIVSSFRTPYFVRPFLNSISLAAAVGALGTVIGFIMAYAIARAKIPGLQKYVVGKRSYVTVTGKVPPGNRVSSPATIIFCEVFCVLALLTMLLFYGMIFVGATESCHLHPLQRSF